MVIVHACIYARIMPLRQQLHIGVLMAVTLVHPPTPTLEVLQAQLCRMLHMLPSQQQQQLHMSMRMVVTLAHPPTPPLEVLQAQSYRNCFACSHHNSSYVPACTRL